MHLQHGMFTPSGLVNIFVSYSSQCWSILQGSDAPVAYLCCLLAFFSPSPHLSSLRLNLHCTQLSISGTIALPSIVLDMVNTRPSNASAHPGHAQLAPKRKRRTAAEMKAAKDAEDSAKAIEATKLTQQEQLLLRIAQLENQVKSQPGAGPVRPPLAAELVTKGQRKGAKLSQRIDEATPATQGTSAEGLASGEAGKKVKKARTMGKYTRADVATIRAALSSPTPMGARQKNIVAATAIKR